MHHKQSIQSEVVHSVGSTNLANSKKKSYFNKHGGRASMITSDAADTLGKRRLSGDPRREKQATGKHGSGLVQTNDSIGQYNSSQSKGNTNNSSKHGTG